MIPEEVRDLRRYYQVVSISTNLAEYPECEADTLAYPDLVQRVEDEQALFIIDGLGEAYPADEFFNMVDVRTFIITSI